MLTQYYLGPYRQSNLFYRTWVGKSSFLLRRRESLGWFAGMLPQIIFANLRPPRCLFLHFDIISRSLILWETIRQESVICNAFIPPDREKYFIRLSFFPFVFTCLQNFMINRESLIKIWKAGGNATNWSGEEGELECLLLDWINVLARSEDVSLAKLLLCILCRKGWPSSPVFLWCQAPVPVICFVSLHLSRHFWHLWGRLLMCWSPICRRMYSYRYIRKAES